jgi:hypothetical protein
MSTVPPSRQRLARRLGWLAVASLVAASLAPSVAAGDKTEITICHATGAQTNPYVTESPAINSSGAFAGELAGGHNSHIGPLWFLGIEEAWGDIIPPYDYPPADFHYAGLNWTAEGQAIYNNDCNIPEATPEPTPEVTPAPTPEVTPAPTPEVTPAPTPEVTPAPTPEATPAPTPEATPASTPEATPAPTPEETPTGGVGGATATPAAAGHTLPPTDSLDAAPTSGGDGWRIVLLALAATLGAALLLTPARTVRKDR